MSLIVRMRKQRAIWWERLDHDRYGKFAHATPIEIACRWDDVAKEFLDSQSEKQVSRSVVYVDRIMQPGDRLKRGEMDSNTATDPLNDPDTFEVRRFDQNPNLRATETLLTAYL